MCEQTTPGLLLSMQALKNAQQQAGCNAAPGGAAALPDPGVLGSTAVLQMPLPLPAPSVGPPPSVNQWNSAFVGYPLWLWSDTAETKTATITVQGYPVTLSGVRSSITFAMGDGSTVTCTASTAWSSSVPAGQASPDCGYVYKAMGRYTITATANWDVTWTAMGQSGLIPVTKSATTALPVSELQSVNTVAGGSTSGG